MIDRIKEINIKIPEQILDYVDTMEHLLELYNYITNLQQENEHLRSDLNTLKNTIIEVNSLFNHLTKKDLDYKSRCEKAVEYMNNTFNITGVKDMFDIMNKLEDILNGRSDE